MVIVIAPDSFKGSLSSQKVADAMETGFLEVFPDAEIRKISIADGGEGTVESLVSATGGMMRQARVCGPLAEDVDADWGVLGDGETAVIEMAAASGLTLVPENRRNPGITTSYGTGELIRLVMDEGYRKIILGIGGSATNDAGAGMAQALGVKFLNEFGEELGFGGHALLGLKEIDLRQLDPRLKHTEITVACDVDNPLCGPKGASVIYGPQKGATAEMVAELDRALEIFSSVATQVTGRNVSNIAGSGAAGGMGAGLMFFTKAVLKPGIQIVMEVTRMEDLVRTADLVVTGEGMTDRQTSFGKAPAGLGSLAGKYNKVAVCISGSLGDGAEAILDHGIQSMSAITHGPISLSDCMSQAATLIEKASFRMALSLRAGMNLSKNLAGNSIQGLSES